VKPTFRLFFKMALREAKKNWSQFLAIVAIGAIAVTLFVGLEANAVSLEQRVDETYANGNMADLWVTSSRYVPKEEEGIASLLKDGEEMEGRFEYTANLGNHTVLMAVSDALPTISSPYETTVSDDYKEDSFVYIDEALSKKSDSLPEAGLYGLGEKIVLNVDISSFEEAFGVLSDFLSWDDYFVSGQNPFRQKKWSLAFTVNGIMKYPENITKASYGTSTLLLSSKAVLTSFGEMFGSSFKENLSDGDKESFSKEVQEVFSELGYLNQVGDGYSFAPNQQLLKIPDESRVDFLSKEIDKLSETDGSAILSVNDRENMPFFITIESELAQARGFTYLFPFVFFFVAVLIILVTTSAMIIRERSQIGTLKALGVTPRGITLFYISIVLALVFLGILIGEILGPLLIPLIMANKYSLIYTLPSLTYVFPVLEGLVSAALFLSVSALTAYLSVHKEARLCPAESLRPAAPHFKARGKEGSLQDKKANSIFLSIKMAFRNIRVSFVKSLMVVIGVMGCTALLVTGYGIEDTVYYGIDYDLYNAGNADITVNYAERHSKDDIEGYLLGIDGVEGAEAYTIRTTTVTAPSGKSASTNAYIVTTPESHFLFAKGLKENEVAVASKVRDKIGLALGDVVSFTVAGLDYEAPIAYFYESFTFNGVVALSTSSLFENADLTFSSAYIDLAPEADPDAVKEAIENNLAYPVTQALAQEDWSLKISDLLSGVLVMTLAVRVFAILLALVVLYNLALLNFNERSRDIATMKVLGFNLKEITASLLFETMTLTLVGVLFGLLLGYPFLLAVLGLNKVEIVYYLYSLSWKSYLIAFALTALVAFAVTLFFGWRSRKIKMVESLKSVE